VSCGCCRLAAALASAKEPSAAVPSALHGSVTRWPRTARLRSNHPHRQAREPAQALSWLPAEPCRTPRRQPGLSECPAAGRRAALACRRCLRRKQPVARWSLGATKATGPPQPVQTALPLKPTQACWAPQGRCRRQQTGQACGWNGEPPEHPAQKPMRGPGSLLALKQ
jgi:hypothetical protein